MNNTYAKTATRITLILSVFVFLAYAFLVRGEMGGATFATGQGQAGIELMIDSESTWNGVPQPALSWELKNLVPGVDRFFNFDDVKPGDVGENTVSIHIDKNPAYVCLDFVNLKDDENGMNEPEALVDTDPLSGELADVLEFFAWHDDGDNIFELGEEPIFGTSTQSATVVLASTTYALSDAGSESSYAPGSTHYFGIMWCAGDMTVDLTTGAITCDPTTIGNEAQTDSMSVDVILRAVQANEQPDFLCVPPPLEFCGENEKGNNGHGNDADRNDDSNPGNSNDPDDDTDDDGLPSGFAKKVVTDDESTGTRNCIPKGNNGHGNDEDQNDDSNPGNSNDPADDTDDDGLPSGFAKKVEPVATKSAVWEQVSDESLSGTVIKAAKKVLKNLTS